MRDGSSRGVPYILLDLRPDFCKLVYLNALRRPGVWKRRSSSLLDFESEGTGREYLQRLGAHLELAVEWPKTLSVRERRWLDNRRTGWTRDTWGPFEIVLEPDRMIVLSRGRAQEFWTSWWVEAEKQRSKK